MQVSVILNPMETRGEYLWTCPICGKTQMEWPDDPDYGPLSQILCENCDEWFDYEKVDE
jgi:hypothetical protein